MAKENLVTKQLELLFCSATIAAHSNMVSEGFRQRDVRFLVDLFSNWIETCYVDGKIQIQNTQIVRFLDELSEGGFVKKTPTAMKPRYKLTRLGLLELLTRSLNSKSVHFEEFLFLHFFINNYGARLLELIKSEGAQFPPSLRMEIEALLDAKNLVRREISNVEIEIKKLEQKIKDATATSNLATQKLKKGESIKEIVAEAEKNFPYELNTQKPLNQLINSIPPEQRLWELEIGNKKRCLEIWSPSLNIFKSYLIELRKL